MDPIIAQHPLLALAIFYVVLAFVQNMPKPGRPLNYYEWLYDSLQVCLQRVPDKYKSTAPAPAPNPTQPQ